MLGIVGESLADQVVSDQPLALGSCQPDSVWGALSSSRADEVFSLVNTERQRASLKPLSRSGGGLESAARWKAAHMSGYAYMAHSDPAPPLARSTGERIAACGYSGGGWGENIAYGYPTPTSVMGGWMNSPGHRANILNASYLSIGIGVAAKDGGNLYWAQCFGTKEDGSGPPPPPPPPPDPVMTVRERMLALKQALGTSTLFAAWRKANPGEHAAIEQFWSQGGAVPSPKTAVGVAYLQAARTYREAL